MAKSPKPEAAEPELFDAAETVVEDNTDGYVAPAVELDVAEVDLPDGTKLTTYLSPKV